MNPLNPLYDAVAWVIMRIHSAVGAVVNQGSGLAWVLSIVILVVLMRLILVPLFVKQMHSTRKMSALAPKMAELRKKYKNDRQTLNEETMKLYRENGVNPLGGCLPLVAQLPLFFALFGVLRGIADWHKGLPAPYGLTLSVIQSAQHANILGATISDKVLFTGTLHVPVQAKIVILCAVVVSVTTTFMTVRQSTKRGMTPQMTPDSPMAQSQKFMQYIVPLFALSGLYWQFGLVLYWMTTNIWTLGQQYVLFKKMPSLSAPLATAGAAAGTSAALAPSKPATGGPKQVTPGNKRPASARPGGPKQVTSSPKQVAKPVAGGAKQPASQQKQSGNGAAKQPAGTAQRNQSAAAAQGKAATSPAAKRPPATAQPKSSPGSSQRKPATAKGASGAAAKPAGNRPSASQQSESNGTGLLRRFGRGRAEPEEQAETPEVKLVRQQRVRQPRSKRSGKR